ncbi:hypothetical protein BDV96DRAFT_647880 [Lophiotrema nucula]|uniref:Uncharacterized protein n=1 Tax=Lophiotrema nucula TaxID=690887 RepID=A0A6A5Z3H5_9PLEO|nr:hypothetical protein BDV96DRAFT_647880 [Lophiotrema nucula]
MAYPLLYKPSRRFFDLPQIDNNSFFGPDSPVLVLFLVKTSQKQRDEIEKLLNVGGELWPTDDSELRRLEIVPWLRNYELSDEDAVLSAVVEVVQLSCAAHILIDKVGLENKTCIITFSPDWNGLGYAPGTNDYMYEHEFARVGWDEARFLVSLAGQNKSWFPDILSEIRRLKMPPNELDMSESQEWEIVSRSRQHKWPSHISRDFKLDQDAPTIISLIYLSVEELHNIKTDILANASPGHAPPKIINWPAGIEPGSEADLWYIFDAIKHDFVPPYGEVFGFFIDSMYLADPDRDPELLMVTRTKIDDAEDAAAKFVAENSMEATRIRKDEFLEVYRAAFNPTGDRDGNAVHHNGAMRSLDLKTGAWSPFAIITNPDIPVLVPSALPFFVLQPISSTQEHALRSVFPCFNATQTQFFHIPDGDGTITHLLRYFQSSEFTSFHRRPPADFVAIDAPSLSSITNAKRDGETGCWSSQPSVLLGTSAFILHEGDMGRLLAEDQVGYAVGRCAMWGVEEHQDWAIRASDCRGLMGDIGEIGEEEEGVTGRFCWDCFGKGDEEVEGRVQFRE